jgi:hypothetical protein
MRIVAKILFVVLLISAPFTALADEAGKLKKKILMDQKKLVVMENMEFTDQEAKGFWPVYEKYQEELFQVGQRAGKLIVAYASVYHTLTDDQAKKIIDEYFDIRDQRQDIMKRYARDLKKVLPAKKMFRYLQVENKLEAIARYELARGIPLAQ